MKKIEFICLFYFSVCEAHSSDVPSFRLIIKLVQKTVRNLSLAINPIL